MATRNSTRIKKEAFDRLSSVLIRLADVRDTMQAIEDGSVSLIAREALTRYSRLDIADVGKEIEDALFDLGKLPDPNHDGVFIDRDARRKEAANAA